MIYVFLADGFEEIEALSTVDILRRAELKVKTVGINKKIVTGAHGISVMADIREEDVDNESIEAIVLPGGMPGTLNLENSRELKDIINYTYINKNYIAAICAAPSILGHMGILKDKEATCFPGFESELIGAKLVDKPVCVDEHIITAKGPGVSNLFGLKLVEIMCGEEVASKVRMSMQCI